MGLGACSGKATTAEDTVMDTGYSTTSTTPASVPALASGITPEQVRQLAASWSNIPTDQWEVRDYKTFGDWAAAKVYTSQLSEEMGAAGSGVVFQKRNGAWFLKDWVMGDTSDRAALTNMQAPEEVRRYFGF